MCFSKSLRKMKRERKQKKETRRTRREGERDRSKVLPCFFVIIFTLFRLIEWLNVEVGYYYVLRGVLGFKHK